MMMSEAVDTAATNLRMVTSQLAGLRMPARVRTIPTLRRRLHVTVICDPPKFVVIRQCVAKEDSVGGVGSLVGESQPLQIQRV